MLQEKMDFLTIVNLDSTVDLKLLKIVFVRFL